MKSYIIQITIGLLMMVMGSLSQTQPVVVPDDGKVFSIYDSTETNNSLTHS